MTPADPSAQRRAEARAFLMSRRARLSPDATDLALEPGERRVPGLRRSEVARRAGVSVQYYTRLERGHLAGVSDSVLAALADALCLDHAEQQHLTVLATPARRAAGSEGEADRRPAEDCARRDRPAPAVPASIAVLLDALATPALVRDERMDVHAANALGRALYADAFAEPVRPVNLARFCFLALAARALYVDWAGFADANVALLRAASGRRSGDRRLAALVAELSAGSAEFRLRWARHDVRLHRHGTTLFDHPIAGMLELTFDSLDLPELPDLPGRPGLTLKAYTAAPGSAAAAGLALLTASDPDHPRGPWTRAVPGPAQSLKPHSP